MPVPESRSPVKSQKKYLGLRFLILMLRVVSWLPLPLLHMLGTIIGELAYWLVGSRRKITKTNLKLCFSGKSNGEISSLARSHFHHLVTGVLTMAVSWWVTPRRLDRLVTTRNRHYLDDLISAGQNVILLAPHFTSLEFLGIALFSKMDGSSMYQRNKNPFIDSFIESKRTRFGTILFEYKDSLKPLIKSIRQGIPFYYLPDQDPGRTRGVFAQFYGIPTATYPALSRMAKLGNAKVLPVMARVKPFGFGIEIIFDPVLENYPGGDEIEDATHMNGAIENLISHAPAQYFWSHKRFKTRPEGEPSFYG